MREAADFLGVSYDYFRKIVKENQNVPANIFIGKRKRWAKSDIIDWARSNTTL